MDTTGRREQDRLMAKNTDKLFILAVVCILVGCGMSSVFVLKVTDLANKVDKLATQIARIQTDHDAEQIDRANRMKEWDSWRHSFEDGVTRREVEIGALEKQVKELQRRTK